MEGTTVNTELTSRLLFAFICCPDLGSSSSSSQARRSVETTLSLLTQTLKRAPGVKKTRAHTGALGLFYKTFFNIQTCTARRLRCMFLPLSACLNMSRWNAPILLIMASLLRLIATFIDIWHSNHSYYSLYDCLQSLALSLPLISLLQFNPDTKRSSAATFSLCSPVQFCPYLFISSKIK